MKSKPLTFLFAFTFLFLFSGSVFGDDLQDGINAAKRGDFKTAYKLIVPFTEEQGNATSKFYMGRMYAEGEGVLQDDKEAIKWFRLSAEHGYAESQYRIGMAYRKGEGVLQDDKEAIKWFRLSQGYAESQYRLGVAYRKGEGVLQDDKEAIKWFRLSAEQGYAESQYRLGVAYRKGEMVPQAHKEATKWLLKSADQKSHPITAIKAQRLIRANYHQWHKQIAEQGDSYAQRFLGASYYLGLGITQDYAEAAKWYKKAAEQEDRVAQNILGAMYEKGKGVSKNFVEAYKWFSLSEEAGGGRMYKEKIGKRKMTSAQIAKAQQLAREWKEKYQKK